MTATHLFRGTPSGEILDADGKVVGRIVPTVWTDRDLCRLYAYAYRAGHEDTCEACYTHVVEADVETYHQDEIAEYLTDHAMLSAAPADWSQHAVRVPERSKVPPFGWLPDDGGEVWAEGFNACLDAIKGAK